MLISARPEEVGLSSARLRQLDHVLDRYMTKHHFPGLVALILRKGKVAYSKALGKLDIERDKPMLEDSLFRIYSMTKPIISAGLMMLYEEGHFQLADPVSKYIPSFKNLKILVEKNESGLKVKEPEREVTIRDLLIHTAGFSYHFMQVPPITDMYREAGLLGSNSNGTLEEFIDKLVQIPLLFSPGSYWHYGLSYDVLGYLIQLFSGMPLDAFIKQRITDPLGMVDTGFFVPKYKQHRFAVCYEYDHQKDLLFSIDDPYEGTYTTHHSFLSGGGGMVSTATDYVRFCQMLLNKGVLDGTQILSKKSIELMTANQLREDIQPYRLNRTQTQLTEGMGFGLGVGVLVDPVKAQRLGSRGEFSWNGLANTTFFVSPADELVGILMAQVITSHSYLFDQEFRIAIYQALL